MASRGIQNLMFGSIFRDNIWEEDETAFEGIIYCYVSFFEVIHCPHCSFEIMRHRL
jgi:hypothetical protein